MTCLTDWTFWIPVTKIHQKIYSHLPQNYDHLTKTWPSGKLLICSQNCFGNYVHTVWVTAITLKLFPRVCFKQLWMVSWIAEEKQLRFTKWPAFSSIVYPKCLHKFWLSVYKSYLMINQNNEPFAFAWLCKYGFSALIKIKSRKWEKLLGIDNKMLVCLTMKLCFNLICSQKQAHPLH